MLCVAFSIYVLKVIDEARFLYLEEETALSTVLTLCSLVPSFMLFHVMRRLLHEKHHLVSQLRNFDVTKVDCRTQEDKQYILNAVQSWYGSTAEFTEHVRGPLADELTSHFSSTDLPAKYWLMIATPFISFNVAEFWVQAPLSSSSAETIVARFLGRCVASSVVSVHYIQLVYFLCHRFSAPAWWLLDYGKTLLIWFVLAVVLLSSARLTTFVDAQGLVASIIYVLAALALCTVIVTRGSWLKWFGASPPSEERHVPCKEASLP